MTHLRRGSSGPLATLILILACASARAQPAPEPPQPPVLGDEAGERDEGDEGNDAWGQDPDALSGAVDEAVERVRKQARQQALQALDGADRKAAVAAFERAFSLDPEDAELAGQLAALYAERGDLEAAQLHYRKALQLDPDGGLAQLALAQLLAREPTTAPALAEASALLQRARQLLGSTPPLLHAMARVAHAMGRFDEAESAYLELLRSHGVSVEIHLELGDLYRELGRENEALAQYRALPEDAPAFVGAQRRIFALEAEREARRLGLRPGQSADPAALRQTLLRAQMLVAGGEARAAIALLRRSGERQPREAAIRRALGDALLAAGEVIEAERAFLQAIVFSGGEADHLEHLADHYRQQPGGESLPDATLLYEQALRARPDRHQLHLKLAHTLRQSGDLPQAYRHVQRYISQPTGNLSEALELRALLESLLAQGEASKADPDPTDAEPQATPGAGDGANRAIARATTHLREGDTDRALAELGRLPASERNAAVLALQGRILQGTGRLSQAARAFEASLAQQPDQAEVLVQLSEVLLSDGATGRARQHLQKAESLGHAQASLKLVELALPAESELLGAALGLHRLASHLDARSRLARLRAQKPKPNVVSEVERLERRLQRVLVSLAVTALLLLAAFGGALGLGYRLRYGGAGLAQLLDQRPEVGPELQRILSSVRHEVLKHNTLMLEGLAESLSSGEGTSDAAGHLERALFAPGGAAERLDGYLDELQRLGRAHGLRLNLRRVDLAFAAITRGFHILASVRSQLLRSGRLSSRSRGRLRTRLSRASELINAQGRAHIEALLASIRAVEVGRSELEAIFERLCREPAFAGREVAELQWIEADALPVRVAMPRAHFEDALTNLLRNALQASLRAETAGPCQLALAVRIESDPVTALDELAFLVFDRAGEALASSDLNAGFVERGLGLTADLLGTYNGSLAVRPGEAGYTKAVALTIPISP
ncbi:MAG: tetratricopeptide repeat protein [Myxococcales bacterium]|nr:tetratricopeptide repeat protein [Myxococcales bacterium]